MIGDVDTWSGVDGPTPIGYYVHHHGAGHAMRFEKIRAACDLPLVAISELEFAGGLRLGSDVTVDGADPTAGGALHWAPVGDPRSARRSFDFGRWLTTAQPRGVVIDVSVEAALLCRLFGVPTIVVRQHGDRSDPTHELALRSACRLLAPYPERLEHPATPAWVRSKTFYAGFIDGAAAASVEQERSAAENHTVDPASPATSEPEVPTSDDVVILWGAGGGRLTDDDVESVVAAASNGRVWFAGSRRDAPDVGDLRHLGWVENVRALLRNAPTVIASAGNNVVADAAGAGCALVVVPQDRPFGEQVRHSESLLAAGAVAVVTTRGHGVWDRAIDDARRRRTVLTQLAETGGGADAAAAAIAASFPETERR